MNIMRDRVTYWFFTSIIILTVILLFTIIDHSIHVLKLAWSVPNYYFRNKIPFGFLWGIVGFYCTHKSENIWIKAMIFSGIVSITLQTRYFIEGFSLNFVLTFLLIHFIIIYLLVIVMFLVFRRYNINYKLTT